MTDLRKEVLKNLCPYPLENFCSCPGEGGQKMTDLRKEVSKNLCLCPPLENFSSCPGDGGQKVSDLRKEVSKISVPTPPRKFFFLFRRRGSKKDRLVKISLKKPLC